MSFQILRGDALSLLRTLPDESVHTCVTSPPYFGLRDYQTGTWADGDPACEHKAKRWDGPKQTQGAPNGHASKADKLNRSTCAQCGAFRVDHQIGLERTPELYTARIVEIFREVRRVLRSDGTCWVNLGDSYAGSWGAQSRGGAPSDKSTLKGNGHEGGGPKLKSLEAVRFDAYPQETHTGSWVKDHPSLKPKDLIGIPWRVAFALQADGWWLRSEIIWHKPNPMPESVTDRPTKAHEQIFLLAKSERYYYNSEAIKEPAVCGWNGSSFDDPRDVALFPNIGKKPRPSAVRGAFNGKTEAMADTGQNAFRAIAEVRNKRSVWTIATTPYSGAHFATFPPDLIDPCILAGCPEGGTVLDPFSGAGTTGLVSLRRGRNYIGLELNPEYVEMSRRRILEDSPLWNCEASA